MVCTTKDIYKSVRRCPGVKIKPGIRPHVYLISKSQILTWPTIPDATSIKDPAELATYKGNFTLASDAKFHRVDLVDQKSNMTTETQGEAPSASFLNKAELVIGGEDEDISGVSAQLINDEVIVLVQLRDGRTRVLGCEAFAPKITVAQTTGTSATDACTSTISVEATDFAPTPFYTGKIETEDGDISGADGSVWADQKVNVGS